MTTMNYDDVEIRDFVNKSLEVKVYRFSNGWDCSFYVGDDNDDICLEFRKRDRPVIGYTLTPKRGKSIENVDFMGRMYDMLRMACQADELFEGIDDDFEQS